PGDHVVAAETVDLDALGGADVQRELAEVGAGEIDPAIFAGRDGEDVAGSVRAVDLGNVGAAAAVHHVRTVAVVPDHAVVAAAAFHGVGAAEADQGVVAGVALQQV